jgi:hypothetical protein
MPTIPLYGNGEQPINMTGVRVPMVAQNVTADPKVGQDLVHAGLMGMDIISQMRHADDVASIANAHGQMDQHLAEQKLFQEQNPNNDGWLPAWQKRVAGMQESVQNLNVSARARVAINKGIEQWGAKGGVNVQLQQVQAKKTNAITAVGTQMALAAQNGNDAGIHGSATGLDGLVPPEQKEAIVQQHLQQSKASRQVAVKNNVAAALDNNQPETAKSWLDEGLKNGALTPEQHAAQTADVNHATEVQSLVTVANDDPRRAIELATVGEQAKRISGVDRVRIVDAAQSKLTELRTKDLKDYTNQIQLGVANKEGMAKQILENSNLEPSDKANLANFLDRGPVNDPIAYASLYAEAKDGGYKEGTPEYSRFVNRVNMSQNGEPQTSIMGALAAAKAPKAMAGIYKQMSDDLSAGNFGALHGRLADNKTQLSAKDRAEVDAIKAEITTPDELARIKTEPGRVDYLEGKARETWWTRNHKSPASGETWLNHVVEDEAAKHAAADRAWEAMKETESFQQKNPTATPEEVKAHYDSQLVRQRGAGNVSFLLPSLETPKVDLNAILKRHATNPGK